MADAPVHRPAAEPAPVAAAAPVVEPAPVVSPDPAPVAAEPKVEAPAQPEIKRADAEPTMLEAAGQVPNPDAPATDAKPADAPKPEEKPADPAKPVEPTAEAKPPEPAKAEPVKYEAFKLPEGARPDDPAFVEATGILSELGVPQERAQALVDKHIGAMNAYATQLQQRQHDVFAETRAEWRKQIMADPVLGGAGHQTAMARVARMRDLFVPAADRKAFDDFCRLTGAGDHPVFHKLMYSVGARFDEPAPAPQPNNPAPDRGGNAKRGAAGRYNHPSSVARRQNGA